ncbi:nicotinate-nucleotide pyrophosphorylase (carboxylating) [Thalassobacillus cyri]|uniref:Probable nicotinate-nucleotide pyrophosphorylase [carboxylating] n=1 Tax=Thalassobacillus cyri TaxID=571932 RepID=A0A1H4EF33_9BACI|nr:carboxylating nicotinate-nucleotide diphosphorylase [Thalassobacillus cyri]SEA83427.1 nicotinate-nucleotide pyrophosphorylase (carboxylating) [Thalassobacillus cyri]
MNLLMLRRSLETFFIEDIGDKDITSDVLFDKNTEGEVRFLAKQTGVLCGIEIIRAGFEMLDPKVEVELFKQDGSEVHAGDAIARAYGNMASLLKGERVLLNLLQRMSGIATLTRKAVRNLDSNHTRICDTRKTTPGLRMLEKYAVRTGGGYNHRNGLYDAVMLKDNHIAFAGSLTSAVVKLREKLGHMVKIEVETETREQVIEAVGAEVDCIMLDNRTPDEIKELVQLVPSSIKTEASGGIAVEQLGLFRDCGVDYISLGCLTHSAPALDISVKVPVLERSLVK